MGKIELSAISLNSDKISEYIQKYTSKIQEFQRTGKIDSPKGGGGGGRSTFETGDVAVTNEQTLNLLNGIYRKTEDQIKYFKLNRDYKRASELQKVLQDVQTQISHAISAMEAGFSIQAGYKDIEKQIGRLEIANRVGERKFRTSQGTRVKMAISKLKEKSDDPWVQEIIKILEG